jgi:hypothetical protein
MGLFSSFPPVHPAGLMRHSYFWFSSKEDAFDMADYIKHSVPPGTPEIYIGREVLQLSIYDYSTGVSELIYSFSGPTF